MFDIIVRIILKKNTDVKSKRNPFLEAVFLFHFLTSIFCNICIVINDHIVDIKHLIFHYLCLMKIVHFEEI